MCVLCLLCFLWTASVFCFFCSQHARLLGDHFGVLRRGTRGGYIRKGEVRSGERRKREVLMDHFGYARLMGASYFGDREVNLLVLSFRRVCYFRVLYVCRWFR